MKKSYYALILIILINIFNISNVFAKEFNDVPDTHWAYEYVSNLSEQGVINGYGDSSFKPSNSVSKAEYIKMLVGCVAQKYEMEYLKDAQSSYQNWFEPYYQYAYNKGYLDIEYDIDELKNGTSREEMANILTSFGCNIDLDDKLIDVFNGDQSSNNISDDEILSHYANIGNYTIVDSISLNDIKYARIEEVGEQSSGETYSLYSDIHNLDQESIDSIYYCSRLNIINGYDDGSFKPEKIMTRAEVSTVIYKFKQMIDLVIPKIDPQPMI